MLGALAHPRERHLMRAPRALHPVAVDPAGAGPALRRAQHDGRPARRPRVVRAAGARDGLDRADLRIGGVERGREVAVHLPGLVAGDDHGRVAVAAQEREQVLLRYAPQHGRAGDLVLVEMQDREHRAFTRRVQEADALPRALERRGLGLAVADDAGDDQLGVVERGAEGVQERVAELAALVDRAGCRHAHVARDPARRRELAHELQQPRLVGGDARIDLGVGPLEVDVRHDRRAAVAGAGHEEHLCAGPADQPVEVRVDEVQARRRAPVPEQPRLDVLGAQRLAQQRVLAQVDLRDREVVRRVPPGQQPVELGAIERGRGVFGEARRGREQGSERRV